MQIKIKIFDPEIKLLRWLGETATQQQLPPELVVETWTIIRYYRKHMVKIITREEGTFIFDPGEAVAIVRALNTCAFDEPLHEVGAIAIIEKLHKKLRPDVAKALDESSIQRGRFLPMMPFDSI